jgi:integrase/recombinase XerD
VSSTMRYVRPSATFIEDAYRRAVAGTLSELAEEGPA